MAIHPSTIAWKVPWAEEPGRLQSMGSQRVGHDWETSLSLFILFMGSQGKNTEVVCHSLLQWTTFCKTSPPWLGHLWCPHTAWLGFIDLDKAVVVPLRFVYFYWYYKNLNIYCLSSSWLCHLLIMWPCDLSKWLTFLCLCLLIYKMGILLVSTSCSCCKDWVDYCKAYRITPDIL